jgi:hypothetical protein
MSVKALCRLGFIFGILSSLIEGSVVVHAQTISDDRRLPSISVPNSKPSVSDDTTVSSLVRIGDGAVNFGDPSDPVSISRLYLIPRDIGPPAGLIIEMSLAPPENIPSSYYTLAKYGRIAVDYTRVGVIDGANLGLAAQALHVAHHLLFYSAGISSDINSDGMFLLSAGLAHYQTGNDYEPFVDAPFVRFRFQSSPDYVFMYSEIETTMHFRQYISGMAGLGLRVSPSLRLMGGFHHTEFVMPSEQMVQMVNGLEGIISWGL